MATVIIGPGPVMATITGPGWRTTCGNGGPVMAATSGLGGPVMAAITGPGPCTVATSGPPGPIVGRTNYRVTGLRI